MQHVPFANGTALPFYSAALHELGHGLGLEHEDRKFSVMGSDTGFVHFGSNWTDYRPGEDSVAGAISNYGEPYHGLPDVGVSIYRRTGIVGVGSTGGAYANNVAGAIRNVSTLAEVAWASNTVIPGPTRRYDLVRGNTYRVELTFENIGDVDPVNVNITGRLSFNDQILNSSDTFVGAWYINSTQNPDFARDAWPVQTYVDVTIPAGASTGNAYLGVTLTCTVAGSTGCTESTSFNNSTYYAVRIL